MWVFLSEQVKEKSYIPAVNSVKKDDTLDFQETLVMKDNSLLCNFFPSRSLCK